MYMVFLFLLMEGNISSGLTHIIWTLESVCGHKNCLKVIHLCELKITKRQMI